MRRHKESWWWNEENALVKEKQRLFKLLKGPKSVGKGADVRRQAGKKSVDVGGRQKEWTI